MSNGYPKKIIIKVINNTINKHNTSIYTDTFLKSNLNNSYRSLVSQDNLAFQDIPQFLSLPFHHRLFKPFRNIFEDIPLKLVFSSTNSLNSHFTRLKSQTPKNKISNVVYKVKCADCQATYIGETCQYIGNRMYQHNYHIKNKTANS